MRSSSIFITLYLVATAIGVFLTLNSMYQAGFLVCCIALAGMIWNRHIERIKFRTARNKSTKKKRGSPEVIPMEKIGQRAHPP